jgi:hypothetical protein
MWTAALGCPPSEARSKLAMAVWAQGSDSAFQHHRITVSERWFDHSNQKW